MSLTLEEKTAARLMGSDGIAFMIEERKKMLQQMVGILYPRIISEEIADLREIADEVRANARS